MLTADPTIIQRAIEVFVCGFAFTRSFTHPYLVEQVGPLWVMRDGPRKRGNYRTEEWVGYHVAPQEIDQIARVHTRGRFCLCVLFDRDESQTAARADFKALGYRLMTTEPLMAHPLTTIPAVDAPAVIARVMTSELAERLAKVAGERQILPEQLTPNAPLRQYVATIGDELVGWVRSIVIDDATWCADMYVEPAFRRRGIARALLSRMLHDDRDHGATLAVLLASHVGAKLYPVIGYQQIGELLLYTPKKQST
jgi:GNAT superfamily N-acetyltransferase